MGQSTIGNFHYPGDSSIGNCDSAVESTVDSTNCKVDDLSDSVWVPAEVAVDDIALIQSQQPSYVFHCSEVVPLLRKGNQWDDD